MNTLLIRADATAEIGTGHVMRCLALAQEWKNCGGKVVFLSCCKSDLLCRRIIDEGIDFIPMENTNTPGRDSEETLRTLKQLTMHNAQCTPLIAVDGYHFDAEYQKTIKEAGYKLLWIDDYGHADYYCADFILNQNIYADARIYGNRETYSHLLLGPRYVLLRREFSIWQEWTRNIPEVASRILVTMGGSDPDNVTLKAIQALQQVNVPGLEARILVGSANPHLKILNHTVQRSGCDFQILTNVQNMPEQMAWADLAISSGGCTCWELAFMGVPSCNIVLADNQLQVATALHDLGVTKNLGWFHDINMKTFVQIIRKLSASQEQRSVMSRKGRQLIDGNGAQAVATTLRKYNGWR